MLLQGITYTSLCGSPAAGISETARTALMCLSKCAHILFHRSCLSGLLLDRMLIDILVNLSSKELKWCNLTWHLNSSSSQIQEPQNIHHSSPLLLFTVYIWVFDVTSFISSYPNPNQGLSRATHCIKPSQTCPTGSTLSLFQVSRDTTSLFSIVLI